MLELDVDAVLELELDAVLELELDAVLELDVVLGTISALATPNEIEATMSLLKNRNTS